MKLTSSYPHYLLVLSKAERVASSLREGDVSLVSAWQSLTDGKRMELVQRYHHLKDMRDKTMDRLDLIGYARLKESARFKGVCDVIPRQHISNEPVDVHMCIKNL